MAKQVCNRCVMDNIGDDTISFAKDGTCNYCNYALSRMDSTYFPNEEGQKKIEDMLKVLKEEGQGKEFDCLMGLSGGLDSAYLAYLGATKWGLRILAVHIDDGFDTDIAKANIRNLCKACKIKLIMVRPYKNQYMDLIRSYIRAGVPGIALPQDNVLLACLRKVSLKYNIKYYLSGANFALESILQRGNTHNASDKTQLLDIHKKFGEGSIEKLPTITLFERYIGQRFINKITSFHPLDYIDYNRERAIKELRENAGFDYYGGKHYESVFTKFVQVYYLPKKFGVDKRKSHLSSLIISGQMTRDEALIELAKPMYDEEQMEKDIAFILEQINMSRDEFEKIMSESPKSHKDYKASPLNNLAGVARSFRRFLGE